MTRILAGAWVAAALAAGGCVDSSECVDGCPEGLVCYMGVCVRDYGDVTETTPDGEEEADVPADAPDEDREARDDARDAGEDESAEVPEDVSETVEDAGEVPEAISCTPASDPLSFWVDRGRLDVTGGSPATRVGDIAAACSVDGYRIALRRGMRLHVEANAFAGALLTVRAALYDPAAAAAGSGTPLVDAVGAPGFTASLDWTAAADGDHLLLIHDLELQDPGEYALNARCTAGCGKTAAAPAAPSP